MAKKGARLKTKGLVIDTAEVKAELKDVVRLTKQKTAELAEESLQAQINAIQGKSAKRRSQIMAYRNTRHWWVAWRLGKGTQDDPLEGARVVRKTSKGRVIVYVTHKTKNYRRPVNLFSILDQGVKTRVAKRRFKYPIAAPMSFKARRSAGSIELGDPEQIEKQFFTASLKPDREGVPEVIEVKAGDTVKGFKGLRLYEATAKWIEEQLLKERIVNPKRRSRIRLRKGDVKITVPDKARFG